MRQSELNLHKGLCSAIDAYLLLLDPARAAGSARTCEPCRTHTSARSPRTLRNRTASRHDAQKPKGLPDETRPLDLRERDRSRRFSAEIRLLAATPPPHPCREDGTYPPLHSSHRYGVQAALGWKSPRLRPF